VTLLKIYSIGSDGLYIGSIEIKKSEIAVSLIIILLTGSIGFLLHDFIKEQILKESQIYNRAFKPQTVEQFQYGAQTSIGNALMLGTLSTKDSVSTEHANGRYMSLEVIKQHYTMHTRIVTKSDSKGRTTTSTEIYYSWDNVGREVKQAKTFSFYDFTSSVANLRVSNDYITTDTHGSDRWQVSGLPLSFNATLLVNLHDNSILPIDNRGIEVYRDQTVNQVVSTKNSDAGATIFDIIYTLIIIIFVVAFVAAKNDWLDGGSSIFLRLPFRKNKT
jgi:hypothetical protein